jgi:hypothetical protein
MVRNLVVEIELAEPAVGCRQPERSGDRPLTAMC